MCRALDASKTEANAVAHFLIRSEFLHGYVGEGARAGRARSRLPWGILTSEGRARARQSTAEEIRVDMVQQLNQKKMKAPTVE